MALTSLVSVHGSGKSFAKYNYMPLRDIPKRDKSWKPLNDNEHSTRPKTGFYDQDTPLQIDDITVVEEVNGSRYRSSRTLCRFVECALIVIFIAVVSFLLMRYLKRPWTTPLSQHH